MTGRFIATISDQAVISVYDSEGSSSSEITLNYERRHTTASEIRETRADLEAHIAGAKAPGSADAGPRSGADIYAKSCVACHTSGVLGAPKLQDAADWAPRLEKGFDVVWQNAIKGINAMPPKGTCSSCSDDDIKAAVEHMIEGL